MLTRNIYVFDCLQGLSIIPDATHAATNNANNTTAEHVEAEADEAPAKSGPAAGHAKLEANLAASTSTPTNAVLCVNPDGGKLTGSVGELILPHAHSASHPKSSASPQQRSAASSSSGSGRKQSSASSSSSSSSSSTTEPPEYVDFDELADQADSMLLSFKCPLSDEREVEWRTLLSGGVLYVDIPTSVLPEGSRDSFISLLEFAEEKLECDKVFVCFKRSRPDRNALMRVFMFLGFTVVPPDYKLCPQNDDIISMVYNIQ